MNTRDYPIYSAQFDEDGNAWSCRVIYSDHCGFEYSYNIPHGDYDGLVKDLKTHEIYNAAYIIDQWIFEINDNKYTVCSEEDFFRHLKAAREMLDSVINKPLIKPMQINTKDG